MRGSSKLGWRLQRRVVSPCRWRDHRSQRFMASERVIGVERFLHQLVGQRRARGLIAHRSLHLVWGLWCDVS